VILPRCAPRHGRNPGAIEVRIVAGVKRARATSLLLKLLLNSLVLRGIETNGERQMNEKHEMNQAYRGSIGPAGEGAIRISRPVP
jgi:hypothetical protein